MKRLLALVDSQSKPVNSMSRRMKLDLVHALFIHAGWVTVAKGFVANGVWLRVLVRLVFRRVKERRKLARCRKIAV